MIDVTTARPPFVSSFTNGILSTQFLAKVLKEDGTIETGRAGDASAHRRRTGCAIISPETCIPMIARFLRSAGRALPCRALRARGRGAGSIFLKAQCGAARPDPLGRRKRRRTRTTEPDENGRRPTIYDTRNAAARAALRAIGRHAGQRRLILQNRLFNGSGHIGHNKFVVYVDEAGTAKSVLTGSTNWTWTGIAGQSNNCIRIDDDAVAGRLSRLLESGCMATRWTMPEPLNQHGRVAPSRATRSRPANRTPGPAPPRGRRERRALVLAEHAREGSSRPSKTVPRRRRRRPIWIGCSR